MTQCKCQLLLVNHVQPFLLSPITSSNNELRRFAYKIEQLPSKMFLGHGEAAKENFQTIRGLSVRCLLQL